MVRELVAVMKRLLKLPATFPVVEEFLDEPTADLLTQRMQVHEKQLGCSEAFCKKLKKKG